jgi:imidazolonepropionase
MTASAGSADWDLLWTGCRAATMAGRAPYGLIEDAAIAVADGRIVYVGPRAGLPAGEARATRDLGGACVTPGLIDGHTHLVFAGERADEFEKRLTGATYEDIQRAGGGIRASVRKTRAADEETLFATAAARARRLMAEGVTTIEIKSGYGLEIETEARMLRVARRIGRELPVSVKATALCAHVVPVEFDGRPDDYIAEVVERMLPALAREGLVDAVDCFCDSIGFTLAQSERVLLAARGLGLPVKLHADQIAAFGAAELAARHGALSAEHLEHASEIGIAAMARARSVAMLLPGAYYFLRETTPPPIDLFRRHGVAMAIASDCNPGSSPAVSLLTMLNMACTLFRMTPEEALAGVTRNAAAALGVAATHGTLAAGNVADLVVWPTANPAELSYWISPLTPTVVVRAGVVRD